MSLTVDRAGNSMTITVFIDIVIDVTEAKNKQSDRIPNTDTQIQVIAKATLMKLKYCRHSRMERN